MSEHQKKDDAKEIQREKIKNMIVDAMAYHWNDWVGDTGCIPNDIELSNSRTKVSFTPKQWAERIAEDVADQLTNAGG